MFDSTNMSQYRKMFFARHNQFARQKKVWKKIESLRLKRAKLRIAKTLYRELSNSKRRRRQLSDRQGPDRRCGFVAARIIIYLFASVLRVFLFDPFQ
jgi:hypothetical protein